MNEASQVVSSTDNSSRTARTIAARGYAAKGAASPLTPFSFTRRSPRAQDVQIEVLYCGVCHSDLAS
jgi:D-arabinose 1-dehydrogenase-like Zn-dependent alcohol dehydrogenase